MITGHQRHTGFFHQLFGLGFQAHGLDGGCRWANEDQARFGACFSKGFVLAQETIAGVNGLGTRGLGRFNDGLPTQVAVFGCGGAHMNGFVTCRHVFGIGVCIGIHRHGLNAHALGCGCHTACNFAAIGNEDFFEHGKPAV